jgi:heme/copper-type cytochrome/quinol oxidase subunit 2
MFDIMSMGRVGVIVVIVVIVCFLALAIAFHVRQAQRPNDERNRVSLVFTILTVLFPPFAVVPMIINLEPGTNK